jgi:hypothetical protein
VDKKDEIALVVIGTPGSFGEYLEARKPGPDARHAMALIGFQINSQRRFPMDEKGKEIGLYVFVGLIGGILD